MYLVLMLYLLFSSDYVKCIIVCSCKSYFLLLYSCVMVKIINHPVHLLLDFSLAQQNLYDIFGLQFDLEEMPT